MFRAARGIKPLYALGRLPVGVMNKTESAYADYLELQRRAGKLLWVKFEGVKLRLADNTFYTPDFVVLSAESEMEIHEVKGARAIFRDDARVKIKMAAELFPFRFLVAYPLPAKSGGGWDIQPVR